MRFNELTLNTTLLLQYEYGKYGTYATDVPERRAQTLPEWEQISLQDYRLRMAQYHQGDEGLRNLRRRAPMMAVWDDHETANVSSNCFAHFNLPDSMR